MIRQNVSTIIALYYHSFGVTEEKDQGAGSRPWVCIGNKCFSNKDEKITYENKRLKTKLGCRGCVCPTPLHVSCDAQLSCLQTEIG